MTSVDSLSPSRSRACPSEQSVFRLFKDGAPKSCFGECTTPLQFPAQAGDYAQSGPFIRFDDNQLTVRFPRVSSGTEPSDGRSRLELSDDWMRVDNPLLAAKKASGNFVIDQLAGKDVALWRL